MVELFKSVFDEEMFADLHYVDENPATVSTVSIFKLDGHIHAEDKSEIFEMSSLDEKNTAYDLKHNFFVKLNFQWHPDTIKYFSGGILTRLFGRRNPKRLQELISPYDWALVTDDIIEELTKLPECRKADQSLLEERTEMIPLYTILGTTIYRIPEDIVSTHSCKSIIYVGQRRSITPIIHRTKNLYNFHVNSDPGIKKYMLR